MDIGIALVIPFALLGAATYLFLSRRYILDSLNRYSPISVDKSVVNCINYINQSMLNSFVEDNSNIITINQSDPFNIFRLSDDDTAEIGMYINHDLLADMLYSLEIDNMITPYYKFDNILFVQHNTPVFMIKLSNTTGNSILFNVTTYKILKTKY